MARKASQIKNVLIKTKTEGSKQAIEELEGIDKAIGRINTSSTEMIGKSRAIAKAFYTITHATKGLENSSKSIAAVGKALNSAFSGNVRQTKAVDSYATNIEFLDSVLRDFNGTANRTAKYMTAMNGAMKASPLNNIASSIEILVGQMQELVEGIDELNQGSRISNARLKQVREYIADVGQSADLTTEQIDDLTRGIVGFNTSLGKSQGGMARYNNGLRRMNSQGRSTVKGFSDIVFGSNPLVNAYAAIAVNVYAASEAFRILNEAANFDRLQEQLASFSAGVSGVNVRELARDLEVASGFALTFKEAISLSTQGTAFNFTSEQMRKLTELTRKASVALGRDFSDSMDRVTKGIAKQEIEVLDEIGVVTRLETAFSKFAPTIGKTVDQLTEYERQVALTNEVMEQLEKKYNGIDAQATSWEKLSANVRNLTEAGLSMTQEFLTPAVGYLNDLIEEANRLPNAVRNITVALTDQAKTFKIASEAGNYAQAITSAGGLGNKLEELKMQEAKLKEEIKQKNAELAKSNALYRSAQEIRGIAAQGLGPLGILGDKALGDTETESVKKAEEELKIVRDALTKGTKAYNEQLRILAEEANIDASQATELTGQKIKAFSSTLVDATRNVTKFANENKKGYGDLSTMVTEINKMVVGSNDLTLTMEASAKAFEKVSNTLELSGSIRSLDELKTFLVQANDRALSLGHSLSVFNESNENNADTKVGALALELQLLERINADNERAGNLRSKQDKQEIRDQIQITKLKLERARQDRAILDYNREINMESSIAIMNAEHSDALESKLLTISINRLQKERDKLYAMGRQTKELDDQLELERLRLKLTKENEAKELSNADIDFRIANNQAEAKKAVQNERVQVQYAQKDLDLRYQKILLIENELDKQKELLKIGLEQEALNNRKRAATARDAQDAFSDLQGLSGLSAIQQGGLQAGEAISKAFADAQETGRKGFSGFVEYLTEDANAFSEMSISLANASAQMFQSLTDAKIAGIDREIEAEQRRDGKSKESLEKIKKLEAQKIKENAKSAKAQVVMSTSVAIMRAFQDFGIWGAIPAAIMAGFGAMQISQINSAANGQLAALNSGGTDGMTITGGDRNNMVDVSSSAQSGESAYFGGLSNNLPGRSGGGSVEAGDAMVLGEVGPEVFIPDVPGTVVPSGRSGKEGMFGDFHLQITATDSKSFMDQIDLVKAEMFDKMDEELRARYNTSLESLR